MAYPESLIESKSFLAPFHNRFGFNDDQDLPPIFPEPRRHHPEESLSLSLVSVETRSWNGKIERAPRG